MTLLVWLLAFPLVAAVCVWIYARTTDADVGQLNKGYTAVYIAGTIILLVLHYV